MTYKKPITIDLIAFEEEPLPSGRKLLHSMFKQKFGTSYYKWTAPWKGDYGIERLFFKALEVEEWNDYDGVWSKELRQASKEVPLLNEIRLPVKVGVGEMTGPIEDRFEDVVIDSTYRVAVELLTDEKRAWIDVSDGETFVCIGEVRIPWDSLKASLEKLSVIKVVSKEVETVTEPDEWDGQGNPYHYEDMGVRFWIRLKAELEKTEYQVIGKEIAANIRSFIRKCLSDHQALKRGFEDI